MKMNTGVNWFVLASSGGGRASPGPEMSMLRPPLQPALCCWTPQSPEGLKALKSPLVTCPPAGSPAPKGLHPVPAPYLSRPSSSPVQGLLLL